MKRVSLALPAVATAVLAAAFSLLPVGAAMASPAAALSIAPHCVADGGSFVTCSANASGGSAPYTYSWNGVSHGHVDSGVTFKCQTNFTARETVVVVDSANARVSGVGTAPCVGGPIIE
jgi:hypothetical protein